MYNHVQEYDRFRILKELKRGGKSKYVQLLENDVIKKKYDRTKKEHLKHFENDVKILKHLRLSPHVPRILAIDEPNLTIYMAYCGKNPIKDDIILRNEVSQIMNEFRIKFGVVRLGSEDNYENWVALHNICEDKDGRISLIDFGSDKWRILS